MHKTNVHSGSSIVEAESFDLAKKSPELSPIVGVLGAKGGVGATTLTVDLAVALTALGVTTTIVDANFQQPDVACLLSQDPEHSLLELLHRGDALDKQIFEACCMKLGDSRVHSKLLSPPSDGSAAYKSNLSELSQCLSGMRDFSPFWVVDLPKHLDRHLVTLTDMCLKIVLVFEASVSGVATCRRWLKVFSDLGYDQSRIVCVLNRAGSKHSGVERQLSTCFDEDALVRIPNASAIAWQCSTAGVPIVARHPNHQYSRAVFQLAQLLGQGVVRN